MTEFIKPEECLIEPNETNTNNNDPVLNCGLSIYIKLHRAYLKYEKRLRAFNIVKNDKEDVVELKFKTKRMSFIILDIKRLLHFLEIIGDEHSFAIIKFYNCDCLTDDAKPFYEDFETPGTTINISKFLFSLKCMCRYK